MGRKKLDAGNQKAQTEKAMKKPDIALWKPKPYEEFVRQDGKVIVIEFDKIFKSENLRIYNRFAIEKTNYSNQLELITKYINYFINKYDTENELLSAYLKIKRALDKTKKYDAEHMSEFIDLIYEFVFTDSMVSKINQLVEDNYLDDIENNDQDGAYKKKSQVYLESLEFKNEHIKILLKISFGIKIMTPLVFHYAQLNLMKIGKESDVLWTFYKKLLDLFSENVNIFNKLYVYVKAKVYDSRAHNTNIFMQREIMGVDEIGVIRLFTRNVLISENLVKYKFNETYDTKNKRYKENVVG